jgi:hypothetical protein
MTRRNCSPMATAGSARLRNRSNSTRRTDDTMNLVSKMQGSAARTVGSLPPCGGEVERGVGHDLGVRGLPPSLTLPRRGGGNGEVVADRGVADGGSARA